MKKIIFVMICLSALLSAYIFHTQSPEEKQVIVQTEFGNIKIKLYNETPLHRDNFIKLVTEKYFDSLLFHRVIKNFMIQGGDPGSRNAIQGSTLGMGGPGYTIPAEFTSKYFHKKGALAAARMGDQENPKKESSGSQFYIVHGKKFTEAELNQVEERINKEKKQSLFNEYINRPENSISKLKLDSLRKVNDLNTLNQEYIKINVALDEELKKKDILFRFTPEQRQVYMTLGGAPHLDGSYTVFGEVVEGLDVIDKIAAAQTDQNDRPLQDIRMQMKLPNKE